MQVRALPILTGENLPAIRRAAVAFDGIIVVIGHRPIVREFFASGNIAHRHEGFWQCMDTLRDVRLLNSLCDGKLPPWDPAFPGTDAP